MSLEELRAEIAQLRQQVDELSFTKDYLEIWQITSYYTQIYHMLKNEECANVFAQKVPDVSIEVFDSGVFEGIEQVRAFF